MVLELIDFRPGCAEPETAIRSGKTVGRGAPYWEGEDKRREQERSSSSTSVGPCSCQST